MWTGLSSSVASTGFTSVSICIALRPELEPALLWRDKTAEDAFVFHWETFARRYRDIGGDLSFNLLNEAPRPRPGYMSREDYRRVMTLSHYRAGWVDKRGDFPPPWWPAVKRDGSGIVSRDTLEAHYEPWGWLVRQGIGVHCGEAGAFNKTPHDAFLRWMCDVLDILKNHSIGWALWNFRGSFGVLDSGREDAQYEDWHGHKLDRKLLTLLQYH
jgi:endoglucanase